MNKKLIAIAVASVMAAPVAMADIKISGRIAQDFTVQSEDGVDPDVTGWSDSGHGRIQFDGTAGNAYARYALDTRGTGGTHSTRQNYIGYKFGGGTALQAGRMETAGKNLEKDPYIATFLETRATVAHVNTANNYGSNGFVNNLLELKMKAGNAKIKLQYDASENGANSSNDGHIGLSVAGKAGSVNYWASYNTGSADGISDPLVNYASQSNIKVGGAMKFGKVKVTLNYTAMDKDIATAEDSATDSIALGANMSFGNGLSGDVTYAVRGGDVTADDAEFLRVAVMKKLGKKVAIYGGYTSTDYDDASANGDTDEFGVGMVVKF